MAVEKIGHVPAQVVDTTATEVKNALDAALSVIESVETGTEKTANELVEQLRTHLDTALGAAESLIGLAKTGSPTSGGTPAV